MDETSAEEDDPPEDDGEEQAESADAKRRRLAKQYLSQMAAVTEDRTGDVAEDLRVDRLQREGKFIQSCRKGFASLDINSTSTRHHRDGDVGLITCLALSTDSKRVVTGGKNNSVLSWDVESGKRDVLKPAWRSSYSTSPMHEGEILCVAISPDGNYEACGGRDHMVRIFDRRSKVSEVKVLSGHNDTVSALAFQLDGQSLYSASFDRTIKRWETSTWAYMETLFGHQVCDVFVR